jgi:predicted DNA-binding transcriptional regulator YafY
MAGITPTQRILSLAAYLDHRRGSQITLGDITRDVPGYDDSGAARDGRGELVAGTTGWETLRKKVGRDLQDLAEHWGIHADWVEADSSYELRPAFFTPGERTALIAAAATVDVEGIPGGRPDEVGGAVDDGYAQAIVRVHALVDPLRDACATRTRVRFQHRDQTRVLEPWALGTWASRWYVAGWDPEQEVMRRYRLDRIEQRADGPSIELAGEPDGYDVPDWFAPELAFDMDPNSWGQDPLLQANVRVDLDHVPAFIRDLGGEVVETDESHSTVAFDVRHYQWTRDRLLSFRTHAVVLEPPALVAMLRNHLSAVAEAS